MKFAIVERSDYTYITVFVCLLCATHVQYMYLCILVYFRHVNLMLNVSIDVVLLCAVTPCIGSFEARRLLPGEC